LPICRQIHRKARSSPSHTAGPRPRPDLSGGRAGDAFHVNDKPMLGATWLFDNGDDVVIAPVLGWDDDYWFVQDSEGAWKVPRAAWLPRARFARAV
jgi:hypothetical protein